MDEIADMSPSLQSALLRVLETGEFRRVGGTEQMRVDIRILAATNRDLSLEVERGKFRNDLFYRLNVVSITIPPLRETKEDIPELAKRFIEKQSLVMGNRHRSTIEVETGVVESLMEYEWPGNVRELRNIVERALILSPDGKLLAQTLPWSSVPEKQPAVMPTLCDMERSYIQQVYQATGRNKTKTAKILDISVRNLYRKLELYRVHK